MPLILHVLPHEGGGGEQLVDQLIATIDRFEHRKLHLSTTREPLRAGPSIARGLARLRPAAARADVVHVLGDTSAVLTLPVLRGRPTVLDPQGLHLLRRARGPALAALEAGLRAAIGAAERTVCASRSERDELVAFTRPRDHARIVEVPNGIPPPPPVDPARRAATRERLGLGEDQLAVLFLGRLEGRKHPLTAIAAAERAHADGRPVVLMVAGDGPLAAEIESRAGPAVRALGFNPDATPLFEAADAFVMPSEREGLSLAVLEALGRGLATVVADGPGNPEAVGEAGIVVPVGDVQALAGALGRLATDRDERARLGAAGRARFEERFTDTRYAAAIEPVFAAAIAAARA